MPPPAITGLSPTSGGIGTSVTITGTDFGAAQGTSAVTFKGVPATPTSWSATLIVVPVPYGADTGDVAVDVGGAKSTGVLFTVSPLPPPATTVPPEFLPKQLFDARMKANDVLQEHLKQIITVASATLVLTVSFLKDVVGSRGSEASYSGLLPLSWIALALSIPCAIATIAILVNQLDKPNATIGKSKYPKSFAAGATSAISTAVMIALGAFSIGMVALGCFGAINYKLFLKKPDTSYQFLSETNAVEIAKKNLPTNTEFIHTSKVELEQSNLKLPGSIAVWHVQLQVKEPAPVSGQPPVSALFDYYVDAMTGQGTS